MADIGDRVAEIERLVESESQLNPFTRSHKEVTGLLCETVFGNAEEINRRADLLARTESLFRDMAATGWLSEEGCPETTLYFLAKNQFHFSESVLSAVVEYANRNRLVESNAGYSIMHAYLISFFTKEGIFDKSKEFFEYGVRPMVRSVSINDAALYRPSERIQVTADFQKKLFDLAKGDYWLLYQEMAMSCIVFLDLKEFVSYAQKELKSAAALFDSLEVARERITVHWDGMQESYTDPNYFLMRKTRKLIQTLKHLTGDTRYSDIEQFHIDAENGELRWGFNGAVFDEREKIGWGTKDKPYAPSFMAEYKERLKRLADLLLH